MLKDKSIVEFNEMLASSSAVPGGGGVSALVGSLACSLSVMVGCLTVGKKKYANNEEEMKQLMSQANELKDELISLIDEDGIAFEPLSKAYSLPKDQKDRDEILEKCLANAAKVPLKIVRSCCKCIELNSRVAKIGSSIAISDAGCSSILAYSALKAASLNVFVNTRLMKNKEVANKMNNEVKELLDKYCPLALETYKEVYERLV